MSRQRVERSLIISGISWTIYTLVSVVNMVITRKAGSQFSSNLGLVVFVITFLSIIIARYGYGKEEGKPLTLLQWYALCLGTAAQVVLSFLLLLMTHYILDIPLVNSY